MPYIHPDARDELFMDRAARTAGELNYVFTIEILNFLKEREIYKGTNTYTDFADVIAALEGAKMEFYRRVVVPYEDKKMKENGDVYGILG